MPYIEQKDRKEIDDAMSILLLLIDCTATAGELNYIITRILHQSFNPALNGYARYNELIGMLECAKLELYRRMVVPYEDKKILQNGDVD